MGAINGKAGRSLRLATTALTPLAALIPGIATSQVITDGTTGPGGALSGPDYQITDDLGTRAGDNLFHSFREFSIGTSQSATFSGSDEIENVISRVTGPNPSDIDGTLRSTMPAADFYFINPNGVTFGPNATLDVQGSFHVSTAGELRFEGGEAFSAVNPNASGFAVAEPRAFGFFDADPGAILVDGSTLEVDEGEKLSLVGGDITIDGGMLGAEAGAIDLLALGGQGEADPANGDVIGEVEGDILLTNEAVIDASGDGGGTINVRSRSLLMEGVASISAGNDGPTDSAGGITRSSERISMSDGAQIVVSALSTGDAGTLVVDVSKLAIDGTTSSGLTGLNSRTSGGGDAGDVTVRADSIDIRNRGAIDSSTSDSGDAGRIEIIAGDIVIDEIRVSGRTGIFGTSSSSSTGDSGDIVVTADRLFLLTEGQIRNSTFGAGNGGDIEITANQLLIDGEGGLVSPGIFSSSGGTAGGNAGNIEVKAGDIRIFESGEISSSTFNEGDAGIITVSADRLLIDGEGPPGFTGILSQAGLPSAGDAGDVIVAAKTIVLRNAGTINSSTFASGDAGDITVRADSIDIRNEGAIDSSTSASGDAGRIEIIAGDIVIDEIRVSGRTGVFGTSSSSSTGDSGDIVVTADRLFLQTEGQIRNSTFGAGNGGDIEITANQLLIDGEGGLVSPGIFSISGGAAGGNAGNIYVKAGDIRIFESGEISSSTFNEGDAGIITVSADRLLIDGEGPPGFTGILSQAGLPSAGDAGDVIVAAKTIVLRNAGTINSSTFASGDAGSVTVSASNVTLEGGRIASEAQAEGGAGDVVVTADSVDIVEGEVATRGLSSEGGRIRISGKEYLVITDSVVTSNGITPQEGASLIELDGKVIALNGSRVTSLTGDGTPITGSGVIDVEGEAVLISPDSVVDASSSVAISGLLTDFSNQLVVLDGQFADASRLLRESCETGGDLGGSTFATSGSPPPLASGDGLLPGYHTVPLSVESGGIEPRDAGILVVPCP